MSILENRWRDRLRDAVRADGRTQDEIARVSGIPPETLSRIMTEITGDPRLSTVACIANAVGTTVGWLLEERGYSLSVEQIERLREAAKVIDEVTGGANA